MAACTTRRFLLADHLDRRPPSGPERTFVVLMCAYAGMVLRVELPGPYTDEDACRYVRACLIPAELLERETLTLRGRRRRWACPSTSCAPFAPSIPSAIGIPD